MGAEVLAGAQENETVCCSQIVSVLFVDGAIQVVRVMWEYHSGSGSLAAKQGMPT